MYVRVFIILTLTLLALHLFVFKVVNDGALEKQGQVALGNYEFRRFSVIF